MAATRSREIAALERIYAEEFDGIEFDWAEVLDTLHEAISPIRVQPVNQGTGAASLDYSVATSPPGVRVIAVGGNSLSRGLTLEGLCVSYFLRNSRAYDTLLQMSRWFGYRDGYRDLCRVWLSPEAEGWYRHVTEATNELKRDFARMIRQKATPAEFGLRVRTHPDTLLITARNKMATGMNVVDEVREISLAGRGIETSRLYDQQNRNEENFRIVDRFLADLVDRHGSPAESETGSALLWREIPAGRVEQLLREFRVHPRNHDFQGDAIADFLADAVKRNDPQLSAWTVALPTKGERGPVELQSGLQIEAKERRVLVRETPPRSLLISGKKARVGSRRDVRHGLSLEQLKAIETEREKDVPEDIYRAAMQAPLLLIYLLRGVERERRGAPKSEYRRGLVLPALGLHFPGQKDQNAPKRYVSYRLTRVAQA
jgi:hypothetical protein